MDRLCRRRDAEKGGGSVERDAEDAGGHTSAAELIELLARGNGKDANHGALF